MFPKKSRNPHRPEHLSQRNGMWRGTKKQFLVPEIKYQIGHGNFIYVCCNRTIKRM